MPIDDYDASPVNGITDCLKYMLKLKDIPHFADGVKKAFDVFILEHNYNADQTYFFAYGTNGSDVDVVVAAK